MKQRVRFHGFNKGFEGFNKGIVADSSENGCSAIFRAGFVLIFAQMKLIQVPSTTVNELKN